MKNTKETKMNIEIKEFRADSSETNEGFEYAKKTFRELKDTLYLIRDNKINNKEIYLNKEIFINDIFDGDIILATDVLTKVVKNIIGDCNVFLKESTLALVINR